MNSRPYSLTAELVVRWDTVFLFKVIVRINGEEREVGAGLNVAQLLDQLGIRPGRVVVELNRAIVPRDQQSATGLKEGDSVEIVHFVGGG